MTYFRSKIFSHTAIISFIFFLGIAEIGDDDVPYTTLLYGTGPGFNITANGGNAKGIDPTKRDTSSFNNVFQSTAFRDSASHGGEDVPIYAIGKLKLFYIEHRIKEKCN